MVDNSGISRHRAASILALLGVLSSVAVSSESSGLQVEVLARDLVYPWGIDFLPSGDALVTEMTGRLRVIQDGTLSPHPIAGVPRVRNLFDVAVHPAFERNSLVYLSYSVADRSGVGMVLLRACLTANGLSQKRVILRVPKRNPPPYSGGRLLFVDASTLLMSIGDMPDSRSQAQQPTSLFGTIVRINEAGQPAKGNPFINGKRRPEVYTYGHRNVQGLAMDAVNGDIWASEHGAVGGDELNRLEPGSNYGWPVHTAVTGSNYNDAEMHIGIVRFPVYSWTSAIAPSGIAIYQAVHGVDIFVASLAGKSLRRIHVAENRVKEEEVLLANLQKRLRDVQVGPDGALYVLTDAIDGELLRIRLHSD